MGPLLSLLLAVVYVSTIVASIWFTATETAVLTVDAVSLYDKAYAGDVRARRLVKLLEDPAHLVMAISVGDVANDMVASSVAAMLGYLLFGLNGFVAMAAVTVVLTLLFGESFPKTIGLYNSERWVLYFSRVISIYARVMGPVSDGLANLSKWLAASLGGKTSRSELDLKRRILELTDVATRLKVLELKEGDVIRRILQLRERKVKDLMMPAKNMVSVSEGASVEEAARVMAKGQSNLLVRSSSSSEVIGVVSLRDILAPLTENLGKSPVKDHLAKHILVREDEDALDVLANMQRSGAYAAMVIGQSAGDIKGVLVLRDLAEEVLGKLVC